MTLEDFFTLTEMKGGLSTITRVEELVSVMQKEKDNATKNIGDEARQWSTVAGVLATTENTDCLDHFTRLGGLQFLNQWLQDAQKFAMCTNEKFVEESIEALLAALEKLSTRSIKLATCEIVATVQQLICHKALKVREKAKILFDSWNQESNNVHCSDVVDKGGASCDEEPKSIYVETKSKESGEEGDICGHEPSGTGIQHSTTAKNPDVSSFIEIKDAVPASNEGSEACGNVIPGEASLLTSLFVLKTSQNIDEEHSGCPGVDTTGTCRSPAPIKKITDDVSSDTPVLKDVNGEKEPMKIDIKKSSPCRLRKKGTSSGSTPVDAEGTGAYPARSSSADLNIQELQVDNGTPDTLVAKYSGTIMEALEANASRQETSPKAQGLSSDESLGTVSEAKELPSVAGMKSAVAMDSMIFNETSTPNVDAKDIDKMDQRSEMELDYGEQDALEAAAGLVTKGVVQKVVDYRETFFCTSSEKNLEGKITGPGSPDTVDDKQNRHMSEQLNQNDSAIKKDLSFEGHSSSEVKQLTISNGIQFEPKNGSHDHPKATPSAGVHEEAAVNTDKIKCDFDLNEAVFAEETESSIIPIYSQPNSTVSVPIAVIPTSKGLPGLPGVPLHFEGELGWKGSAATSAFRHTSPRKTSDAERSYLGETSSQGSRQKQNILKIDLNVVDSDEDPVILGSLAKQTPVSSGIHSGESSVEVSSKKADRLKLDLNQLGDHEETNAFPLLDHRVDGRLLNTCYQNGNRSPSPASSSSSKKPSMSSMRDFDLNNNPSFMDVCGSLGPRQDLIKPSYQANKPHGTFTWDDPTVSITGMRMDVGRKDFMYQTQAFLPSVQGAESSVGNGGAEVRPVLAYDPGPPSAFGYSGPSIPLPPQMYGPASVPYLIDSRGATVIPQVMGSSSGVSLPFTRPPFVMSVTSPPCGSGMEAFPPIGPGLDLNSGVTSNESRNPETSGVRHLFVQGHGGLMEEWKKPGLQSAATGISLKRKEPECGWELNLVGYKHEASWHHH